MILVRPQRKMSESKMGLRGEVRRIGPCTSSLIPSKSVLMCVLDRQTYVTVLKIRNVTSGEHVATYNTLLLSGDGGL